jgi:hypothetical protein
VRQGVTAVSLLYTAALEGRLAFLPRLFTRIRQERASAAGITLLADLGRSCAPGAWICGATGGRAMLVAMDAMGYDVFHIGPQDMLYTQPAVVEQLRGVIQTQLAAGPWTGTVRRAGKVFVFANRLNVPGPADLTIALRLGDQPVAEAAWDGTRRTLLLDAGWTASEPLLGRLDMALLLESPYIEITSQAQLSFPPDLPPDPTIKGVIEFVESEAHHAEQKRGQGD